MFTARWVCRSCARSLARPLDRSLVRFAGTATNNNSRSPPSATQGLPPVLLQRARNLAAEHAKLSETLSTDFDPKTAKRAGELSSVATALKEWETAQSSLADLAAMLKSPDSDAELRDLAQEELTTTEASLEKLSTALSASLTPADPFGDMPCMIEIRPGPGGMEGRYFADAIVSMYRNLCAREGLRVNIVKYELVDGDSSGDESPLAEAVLQVTDAGAYDKFRGEAGMHRVQRIPITESKGRVHTSAVAVWVLPSFPEHNDTSDFSDPESLFYVDPKEVRSEKMRAGGAGGQHVNKTESAVRLTHEPTGITVSMQDSRSQHANREAAWTLLRSRLAQQRREEREEKARSLRSSVLSKDKITRSDKIRTYNFNQDRCTDHRSGLDVFNLDDVLKGGPYLTKIMDSAKEYLVQKSIEVLLAEETAAASENASKTKKQGK